MTFSIVVPVYNAKRYLPGCAESVAAQTYGGWQLVLVDDGSTDGSGVLCDDIASRLGARAVVAHRPNAGPLLARRVGFRIAEGDYVVALDADDALRLDALEILAAEIGRMHADVVAFGMSRRPDYSRPQLCPDLPLGDYAGQGFDLARRAALRGRFNNVWGKALARSVLDSGADYSTYRGLMYGEDLFQLLPVMDAARSCTHIGDALYYYRRHEGQGTASYRSRKLDDIEVVAHRMLEYGRRWGMEGDAVWGALMNVYSTVRILLDDPSTGDARATEFARVADVLRRVGLGDESALSPLPVDARETLRCILAGRFQAVLPVAKTLGVLERTRCRLMRGVCDAS